MNKSILKYFLLFILIIACRNNKQEQGKSPILFPQAKSIEANPENGFTLNQFTGDSIEPLINSLGDTIISGIPIVVKGRKIDMVGSTKPETHTIPSQSKLTIKDAHPNRHNLPENLDSFKVNQNTLTKIPIEEIAEINNTHYLINSTGDTIKTGIPIPTKGKIVKTIHSKPKLAQAPRVNNATINNMQYLDVDQGMASSYIYSILEDKRGNIWFGTAGGGVSMYNGETFTHYTEKEGLSSNMVFSILEDKNGNIWFGTNGGGVSMYNGETFTHYTENEGLSNNAVWSMLEDKHGSIWFGTYGGGVSKLVINTTKNSEGLKSNKYKNETFTHYTKNEGLSNNMVLSIVEDKTGNLWFGTTGGGVNMYNGESFTHYTEKDGLSNNIVKSILEDKNGNLWFGTAGGGISMYNGKTFTHYTEKDGLSNNRVFSILEDKNNNLWFSTYGGGVSMYNGKTFTHYTENEGLSNNAVWCSLEDNSGNLWFGTAGGVNIYNGKTFSHFTEKEGLSSNTFWSILEDKKGSLWFGSTTTGGLSMYNGKTFTHFTENEGLSSNVVKSILEDKNGNLWFGTDGNGVSMYNGETFTYFTVKNGLSNNRIFSIAEDKNGNIWFATYGGGICMYNGETFTNYTDKQGLSNNFLWSVIEDKSNNLWFASNGGGVSKLTFNNSSKSKDGDYSKATFTHYTEKEGLSNNIVKSILEDSNGNLWFGTEGGGVNMYNGTTFTYYSKREGLSSNIVKSILEDRSSNIWLGTESGLNQLVINNLQLQNYSKDQKTTYFINSFSKNDGLKSIDFYAGSAYLDSKNRAWWSTGKSLTMLDLNIYNFSNAIPVVHLKQVDINQQFIDYRNITEETSTSINFKDVQSFENYPLNLELAFDKNHLTFNFAAIEWSAPHKIKYSYIMKGLNTEWSKPSHETKADYRNLPYGDFTFKVMAIGESGEWSKPIDYQFKIHPPWWHTWWARTGYGIIALLLLLSTVKWRTAKLKQRQIELETEVKLATEEITQQKSEIEKEKQKSDELLLNILPEEIAEELKLKGFADAQLIDQVSVLFTDFKGFTAMSELLSAKELVSDLNRCFSEFDKITSKYGIEKIKTIGDAYMAAGGLPSPTPDHAKKVVLAALEMKAFVQESKQRKQFQNLPYFEVRIGIHTGPVVAGIVGVKKFQYDIWGDTVNTASRMESAGEVAKVNISQDTYELLKNDSLLYFESRGKIEAKGKGKMEMWFVSLKTEKK